MTVTLLGYVTFDGAQFCRQGAPARSVECEAEKRAVLGDRVLLLKLSDRSWKLGCVNQKPSGLDGSLYEAGHVDRRM